MALAAGGRDSVDVRDMAMTMAGNLTDDRLRNHGVRSRHLDLK